MNNNIVTSDQKHTEKKIQMIHNAGKWASWAGVEKPCSEQSAIFFQFIDKGCDIDVAH